MMASQAERYRRTAEGADRLTVRGDEDYTRTFFTIIDDEDLEEFESANDDYGFYDDHDEDAEYDAEIVKDPVTGQYVTRLIKQPKPASEPTVPSSTSQSSAEDQAEAHPRRKRRSKKVKPSRTTLAERNAELQSNLKKLHAHEHPQAGQTFTLRRNIGALADGFRLSERRFRVVDWADRYFGRSVWDVQHLPKDLSVPDFLVRLANLGDKKGEQLSWMNNQVIYGLIVVGEGNYVPALVLEQEIRWPRSQPDTEN